MRYLLFLLICVVATSPSFARDNIVVVLDNSGSMRSPFGDSNERRMETAKDALINVISKLESDDRLGIYLLNGGWLIPLDFVKQSNTITSINQIRPTGGTPLGESIKESADALLNLRSKEKTGIYKLLIITDGLANDNHLVNTYMPEVNTRGILVDAIGVDMKKEHPLAHYIPNYKNAADPASLKREVESSVLAEIASGDDKTTDTGFEELQSLPDDVSLALLTALVDSGNQPIGEEPVATVDESGKVVFDENNNVVFEERSVTSPLAVFVVIVFMIIIIIFIVAVVVLVISS